MGWKTTWATATRNCRPARPDLAAQGQLANHSPAKAKAKAKAKAETVAIASGPLNNSAPPAPPPNGVCRPVAAAPPGGSPAWPGCCHQPPAVWAQIPASGSVRADPDARRPPSPPDTRPGFATQAQRGRLLCARNQQAQTQPRQRGLALRPAQPLRQVLRRQVSVQRGGGQRLLCRTQQVELQYGQSLRCARPCQRPQPAAREVTQLAKTLHQQSGATWHHEVTRTRKRPHLHIGDALCR